MKKFIVILVIMTLPMIAMAKSVRIDNIEYELYTEAGSNILCARVIRNYWKPKMHAYKGDVVIPEKIVYKKKEYIVREIGKQKLASHAAFEECESLISVTIPKSVKYIGIDAFSKSGLKNVVIPDGVTYIGTGAFRRCEQLTSVSIPNTVTEIDGSAFAGCIKLTNVNIPNSVTSIGGGAFYE